MAEVLTFETPSLGDRSYLVTDGEVAVVVDPQRDIDRFTRAADEAGVSITHVCETHVHNDYVSGGPALVAATGATYVLAKGSGVHTDHEAVVDGSELHAGDLTLRVVATPGHTPDHVGYALVEAGRVTDVFTGGSLLYGAVGRPDLVSEDITRDLARAQFRSAHRLADELPDTTRVHPTHGFGSHCASTTTDELAREGTIGDERERNPALTATGEDAFVADLLAGLHPYPAYYVHMGPRNVEGATAPDLAPPTPVDADQLHRHLADGHWVVDLRTRRAFAADHVAGTINVELRNDLPTYLGWVMPIDAPLVLLGDDSDAIAEAQRMIARIGIDHPAGAATGAPDRWAAPDTRTSWPATGWNDLAQALDERDDVVVLDVRDGWEYEQGHHPRAVHVPFHEVVDRADEIPPGQVWVYCATGNRAAVASSLLAREGRDVVLLDDFCLPGDTPGAEP